MKTKIYRLVYNLNSNRYLNEVHELIATETDKTYKDIKGNCGWSTIVKKSKLGEIHSGALYGETLTGFHYEVFCLEEDIERLKTELSNKISESFDRYYEGFKKMEQNLKQML